VAETCAKAFGRYLKTLRERRGLALDDVASLSRSYADPVAKSYLSRVENGVFSLALSKMIPLCRIYEIPTEALVERLELDMELDRTPVESTATGFAELIEQGKASFEHGKRLQSYGLYRDATELAHSSKLRPDFSNRTEQCEYSWIMVGSAADSLGRYKFALHELMGVKSRELVGPRLAALVLDRLASVHLHMGDLASAMRCADSAIAAATANHLDGLVGYFYMDRATIARRTGDYPEAIRLHQAALEAFKLSNRDIECARALHSLAVAYFYSARYGAARRTVLAAERLAERFGQERLLGLTKVLLGDIESQTGSPRKAVVHWQDALEIAKRLNDTELLFQAHYYLYRHARESGDVIGARSLERKLTRYLPWIRSEVSELHEFRRIAAEATP